jgi:type IV secretory pathway VirJ component
MPLYNNSIDLVRLNLTLIARGERPKVVSIGYLTDEQHIGINEIRKKEQKPLLVEPIILFMGKHLYNSRIVDGYTVEDMVLMVESALSANSIAHSHHKMTGIMNHNLRSDNYGNKIHDLGIFELYAKRPKAELFSVIPKGDSGNRPIDKKK